MRTFKMLLTPAIACAMLAPVAASAADEVDLLLVLAVDVSRSIDAAKFRLQREASAAAVADPRCSTRSGIRRVHRAASSSVLSNGPASARKRSWSTGASSGIPRRRQSASARSPARGATVVRGPYVDQRCDRVCNRAFGWQGFFDSTAGPSMFPVTAPQCWPRCYLQRDDAVAKGITINGLVGSARIRCRGIPTTPIPGRPCQLLQEQCDRRSQRLRQRLPRIAICSGRPLSKR